MKLRFFAILPAIALILSSCGMDTDLPGEELILAAREWYASLDSAHVDVVDDDSGESEQTFIFKYDEKGIMTYSYFGVGDGVYLEQYNNGREQFTNDNGEITTLDASDINFTAYSRDVPYPMADEGLILFYKRAVIADGSYINENDSGIEICHKYDPSKIGEYDGEGTLTGFEVTYRFDTDGGFVSLTEVTTVEHEDGSSEVHSYTIYITEINSVKRVENIVDIDGISG